VRFAEQEFIVDRHKADSGDASLPLECLAVDRRSRVSGNEDEHFGSVGKGNRVQS
jgi:hypothetical protein